jgi:hypothetical protein
VTGALPGADVRGFYQALGIELPGGAQHEAPVRCFADPDAQRARGPRPVLRDEYRDRRAALLGVRRQGWRV